MQLTHTQKNYIKKQIKHQSLDEISNAINLSKEEILNYLHKKWGQKKVEEFLGKNAATTLPKNFQSNINWLKDN